MKETQSSHKLTPTDLSVSFTFSFCFTGSLNSSNLNLLLALSDVLNLRNIIAKRDYGSNRKF